ncbi:MAG TPA: hypothetical protein VGQ23_04645 [Burkholderiaceae bacterium]|jgi:hypothetical protein|nr:hypothetical protein [Burkholderiaceae bacterium]
MIANKLRASSALGAVALVSLLCACAEMPDTASKEGQDYVPPESVTGSHLPRRGPTAAREIDKEALDRARSTIGTPGKPGG